MKNFLIIDASNMFHRSLHVTSGNIDIKLGMALHITFNSIKKAWNDFKGDHESRHEFRKSILPYDTKFSDLGIDDGDE